MNADYENRLEMQIDRMLKRLPDWAAPQTLLPRLMAEVARRSTLPWHRRSWQTWPGTARGLLLIFLCALFGTLCFAGWFLPEAPVVQESMHEAFHWCSGLTALGNALSILVGVGVSMLKQISLIWILPCLVSLALGYAMCVGLSAVCVRWAFARS